MAQPVVCRMGVQPVVWVYRDSAHLKVEGVYSRWFVQNSAWNCSIFRHNFARFGLHKTCGKSGVQVVEFATRGRNLYHFTLSVPECTGR